MFLLNEKWKMSADSDFKYGGVPRFQFLLTKDEPLQADGVK